ncbi:MAG TPA: PVC-type heme-binding CxxCH protein, partial [Chthoniobacteraceae bacterium]
MRIRFILTVSISALTGAAVLAQNSTPAKDTPTTKSAQDAKAEPPKKKDEPNRGGDIDLASSDPAVALQRFTLQEGYEINLFASEKDFPELAKPVAMTWDDRGRLWVATMVDYPHVLPGVPPNDKILILEDTNQDGKADKCSVWADGLYMPTGFELGDGGAYVGLQPNVEFLKDTDGDGKADFREKILHGFGTEDSHHAVHAFQWTPEGALVFHEGVFHNTQTETPYGRVRVKDAAVFRYDPRPQRFSVLVSYGFANPWGHVFDRWGSNFLADASGGSNYFASALTGSVDFPRKHPPLKVFTSIVRPTAGCEIISSRHFPEEAQGNFLVNNNIGFQGIKQHQRIEEGSGYTSKELPNLLESSDLNFRPVAINTGPDGALYVVDWWNPLIGHMQYSLRDPRRDKSRGRVWRITAKGRPLVKPPKIAGATVAEKIELLKTYEDRTRYRARVSLREHPVAEVQAELKKWIAGLDKGDANYEHHLLEALWLSQTIGEPDVSLLRTLLQAKDYHIRSGAARALRWSFAQAPDAIDLLKKQVADEAPRVRMEALLTLSDVRTPESASIALEALKLPTDYYLDYVLKETIATLEPNWKPILLQGKDLTQNNPKGAAYLLARLSTSELIKLAKVAGSKQVYETILARSGVNAEALTEALNGLAKANGTAPLEELNRALQRAGGDARKDLARVLTRWNAAELAQVRPLLEQLATKDEDAAIRQAGFAGLMRADGSGDKAWALASESPALIADLLDGTALISEGQILQSLYGKVQPLLANLTTPQAAAAGEMVSGRFVRIEVPGDFSTLALAEVEVFSNGENVARKGKASQASTNENAEASRAIDGRTDGAWQAGTIASSREASNTPWWEVDLGSTAPIDRIILWNRTDGEFGKRLKNFRVHVLDARREIVFRKEGIPAPERNIAFEISAGADQRALRNSVINAVVRLPGHETETFASLAKLVSSGIDVPIAVA